MDNDCNPKESKSPQNPKKLNKRKSGLKVEGNPCVLTAWAKSCQNEILPYRQFQLTLSLSRLEKLNFLSFVDFKISHKGEPCYRWFDGGFIFSFTYNHHYKTVLEIFDRREHGDPDQNDSGGPDGPDGPDRPDSPYVPSGTKKNECDDRDLVSI